MLDLSSAEYSSLREEQLSHQKDLTSILTVALTAAGLVLTYGLQNVTQEYGMFILVAPIVILIPAAKIVASKRGLIYRIASYIEYQIEPREGSNAKWFTHQTRLRQACRDASYDGWAQARSRIWAITLRWRARQETSLQVPQCGDTDLHHARLFALGRRGIFLSIGSLQLLALSLLALSCYWTRGTASWFLPTPAQHHMSAAGKAKFSVPALGVTGEAALDRLDVSLGRSGGQDAAGQPAGDNAPSFTEAALVLAGLAVPVLTLALVIWLFAKLRVRCPSTNMNARKHRRHVNTWLKVVALFVSALAPFVCGLLGCYSVLLLSLFEGIFLGGSYAIVAFATLHEFEWLSNEDDFARWRADWEHALASAEWRGCSI